MLQIDVPYNISKNRAFSQLKKPIYNSKIEYMNKQILLILLAIIVVAIVIIVIAIARNNKKAIIKKDIEDLTVRYNAIKTIPLAFKLNKAQAMAKRSEDTSEKVDEYHNKYLEIQKQIDLIGDMLDEADDSLASRSIKHAEEILENLHGTVIDCENDIKKIDAFLDQFSKKEDEQRAYSARLKEKYGEIKNKINENANNLSVAYDGIENELIKCEELFSKSEEWIYAGDYELAKETLEKIKVQIELIENCYNAIPELIKDAKGVIPVLYDEACRQFSLCRQRGVYLDHLSIETRLQKNQMELNECVSELGKANYDGIKDRLTVIKDDLNAILNSINEENDSFTEAKNVFENTKANINSIKTLYTYVDSLYTSENEHFEMNEIGKNLEEIYLNLSGYQAEVISLSSELTSTITPASEVKNNLKTLFDKTQTDLDKISSYKQIIDKNTSDEERAKTQLVKLQVVLNEIEIKVLEHHLPTIASNYHDDLLAGRKMIARIKELLAENPLNIEELNKVLDEAISFIYTFYNNVNNIVGMAVMVEKAIVFGNKFRSSNSAIDRDLSKSEFSYLNGEYTKSLKMAIECMDTLFPNKANEKILENS